MGMFPAPLAQRLYLVPINTINTCSSEALGVPLLFFKGGEGAIH